MAEGNSEKGRNIARTSSKPCFFLTGPVHFYLTLIDILVQEGADSEKSVFIKRAHL